MASVRFDVEMSRKAKESDFPIFSRKSLQQVAGKATTVRIACKRFSRNPLPGYSMRKSYASLNITMSSLSIVLLIDEVAIRNTGTPKCL